MLTGCQVESDDDSGNSEPTKKTFIITFNANGGEGEMNALTAEEGTEIALTANTFTKVGYTFSGWATSASGNIVYTDGAKIKLTENLTLYAQWTEIGKVEKVSFSTTGDVDYNEKITLSCGTDGATIYYAVVVGTNAPTAEEFSSSKQKYSEPITITENAVIVAAAVKDGMKDSETATAAFTVKTYTVTFETEHGTAPAKIEGLKKGEKLTEEQLKALEDVTGYKFDGWFNGETQFTTETEITSNITLTAKWLVTYTITFDANGGTGTIASITEVAGTEITLPESTFTKDSYIFAGWNTKDDGTGTNYEDKAKITVTGNITLYAKWVVTAANISEAIKNIPADGKVHTVALVGEISEDTITAIRDALYENSDAKINLDMSDTTGLTKIPDCAFFDVDKNAGCKALAGIVLPKGIESIGDGAFAGSSLPSITFGSGLESIGGRAFSWCDSLTEITIPGNVKIIEIAAFAVCPNLEKVVLEEGVQTIRELAFGACEKLASVTIPKSVTSIEDSAFDGCYALQTVSYGGTIAEWNALKASISTNNDDLLDAVIYCTDGSLNTDAASVIKRLGEGEHTVTVTGEISTDYLVEIAEAIYDKNDGDIKIILDLSDTTGLTEIPEGIFKSQGSLVGIMLPQSVTKIGEEAFSYSDLSKITIPDSVTEIGESAFEGCAKLKSVKIGSKVAEIGAYAFMNCTSLTSIEIPDSVISVDNQIFSYCPVLKNVTLGKGITSISTNMFSGCSALEKIEIPDGVKSIKDCAFDMCEKLESITIPTSVTSIVSYAFDYCTSLADVYYSGTVAEWNALKDSEGISSSGNDALFNATIHCTDGDITPTTGE